MSLKIVVCSINERGCWIWTGGLTAAGYAKCKIRGTRQIALVHRLCLAAKLNRSIAKGMEGLHSCDTPACVNPEHCFEGTHTQNMTEMRQRGRANDRWGENVPGAKLTVRQVAQIRVLFRQGKTNRELASMFDVGRTCISNIRTSTKWARLQSTTGGDIAPGENP